jgi:hypothetical protein
VKHTGILSDIEFMRSKGLTDLEIIDALGWEIREFDGVRYHRFAVFDAAGYRVQGTFDDVRRAYEEALAKPYEL